LRAFGAGRFALIGGAIVAAAGAALLPLAIARGTVALQWGLAGWLVMAITGLAGGIWLVWKHGKQGSGFLVALGTCMLARLFASAAGAFGAAMQGMEAVWPYLIGLVAGYIPLQLFEIWWFVRSARRATLSEG
jgi:hypothetical protein